MRTAFYGRNLLILLAMLVLPALGLQADTPATGTKAPKNIAVVDTSGDGAVDWSKQELRAIGLGLPPKYASGGSATVLAREAAIVCAERNLLKLINGVHISSETTVKNLLIENDTIKTKVEGLLKGATIISEKILPDNTYQVVLGIDLYGEDQSLAQSIDLPKQFEKAKNEKPADTPPAATTSPVAEPPATDTPAADTNTDFTGLVVDCRGLALARSMCPRLLDQTGNNLWGPENVSTELINEKGIAGYSKSLDDPDLKKRVGKHPLIVKAIRASGGKSFKADAVLSPADCEHVRTADEKSSFLEKLNVVFLVD